MIGSKCLLDTSVIIEAFKSHNKVVEKLDTFDHVYVSVIAVGELYFGVYRSSNPLKHLNQVNSFLNNCNILETDKTTANIYGVIKAALAKKGKPIPENDIWIGAVARQWALPLFTIDEHFREIDEIVII